MDTAKEIRVVLENNGPEVAHVTVNKYGLGGPGFDWLAVGKEAMTAYLTGGQLTQLMFLPGEACRCRR